MSAPPAATRPSFGLLLPMAGNGLSAGTLLAELTEEVKEAERTGLDFCLFPEHHDGPPGALTDPLTVTAWLLARTERIKVGPGVLLLPLYPPAHVAEWAATLQHASGGRLLVTVGAGYQDADFARYGIDRSERVALLERGMAFLRAAWAGEESAGAGAIVPALAAGEAPPLWLGAWSPAGVRRAARLADAWVADPIRSVAEVEEMAGRYREAARAVGRHASVVLIRELWVDESDERARRTYEPVVGPVFRYYARQGAFPEGVGLDRDAFTLEALRGRVLWGGPERVAGALADTLRRTGADACALAMRHPAGPPHGDVMAAVRRLGGEVLPEVRRLLAGTTTGSATA